MADEREQYAQELLGTVNEAANAVSARFFTFVTVSAYVAVTVAATTDEMLLRTSNLVPLPLLNTQIPIVGPFGFYTIAPWLIVLLHSDVLLQLSILASEMGRFERETTQLPEQRRTLLRQRVANFYYVLYLSAAAPSRFLHILSAGITSVMAVLLPLALLLWIQIRFLTYHGSFDTWLHRAAVLADVSLVGFILLPRLWPRLHRTDPSLAGRVLQKALSVPMLIVGACAVTAFVSLFVATIPSDSQADTSLFARNMRLREQVLTTGFLSPQDINALRDLQEPAQLEDVLKKVMPFQALQGRDLRYADWENAVLPRLDLRATRTSDARLDAATEAACLTRRGCEDPPECTAPGLERTQLRGANFTWASMQWAMLNQAVLDDANFAFARMQKGSLQEAHLNRATLNAAKLHQADLSGAKLCGANLSAAELPQAFLNGAFLQGANLYQAKLTAAHLVAADLRGADLSEADLSGADLTGAQLQGAVLHGAVTKAAVFDSARVDLTDLSAGRGQPSSSAAAAVNAYLVELACADASAAYGIAWQALHSPYRDGPGLARALLDGQTRADCVVAAALGTPTKGALARRAGESR